MDKMEILGFIRSYWDKLIGAGALAYAGKLAFENRKALKMFAQNILWAAFNPKKVAAARSAPEVSKDAKLCPSCDRRMRITWAYPGQANFLCEACDVTINYKIGH